MRLAHRGSTFSPHRIPPARWALACKAFENGREVWLSLEANVKRQFCKRQIRAYQHRLRTFDALVKQIFMGTISRRNSKLSREVHPRQTGNRRQIRESQRLVK